jgi:hypothetical protein
MKPAWFRTRMDMAKAGAPRQMPGLRIDLC